jgi:hypothetical protein
LGASFHNFHVYTTDVNVVRDAIVAVGGIAAFVSDVLGHWVSVFPEERVSCKDLAQRISGDTDLPVLYLWEYDSDVAGYCLYESGTLWDEFESNPDYSVGDIDEHGEEIAPKTEEERARLQGESERLIPYCLPEVRAEQVAAVLESAADECADADNVLSALTELLGIPPERYAMAYRFVLRGEAEFTYEKVKG